MGEIESPYTAPVRIAAFDSVFSAWKPYYLETEVRALITPAEALGRLLS